MIIVVGLFSQSAEAFVCDGLGILCYSLICHFNHIRHLPLFLSRSAHFSKHRPNTGSSCVNYPGPTSISRCVAAFTIANFTTASLNYLFARSLPSRGRAMHRSSLSCMGAVQPVFFRCAGSSRLSKHWTIHHSKRIRRKDPVNRVKIFWWKMEIKRFFFYSLLRSFFFLLLSIKIVEVPSLQWSIFL